MLLKSLEKGPQVIQFETHSMCNAKCNFCCHSMMKRKKGKMSDKLINKILEQTNDIKTLIPFLMGEPFLDNRIIEILKKCRTIEPKCNVVLHSNMSLCNKDYALEIINKELVDVIHISFYGVSPEQYKNLQGLDYYNVIRNIIFLIKERNKRGKHKPLVICDYILMEELLPYLNAFKAYWEPIVDEVRTVYYDDWHGDQPDRGCRLHPVHLNRIPCYRLWYDFNVHWNGNVPLCCIDYDEEIILGNVNKKTIKEIWQGTELSQIRDLHITQKYDEIPICNHCKAWKYSNPSWWNTMWNIIYSEV